MQIQQLSMHASTHSPSCSSGQVAVCNTRPVLPIKSHAGLHLHTTSYAPICHGMQIYKAERAAWPVRVYNLLYEDSQEADKFLAAVAREACSASEYCWVLLVVCSFSC